MFLAGRGRRWSRNRVYSPGIRCAEAPPAFPGQEQLQRGVLEAPEGLAAWWRQDREKLQVIVRLGDDVNFKRDVRVDLSRTRVALRVRGADVLRVVH